MSGQDPKKRSASSTTAASTAAGKLQRHLQRLEMGSTGAYLEWCRRHGFRPSLVKDWSERAAEQQRHQELAVRAAEAQELDHHLRAMCFSSVEEYTAWCRRRGLPTGLNKSRDARRQEIHAAEQERAQAVLAGARRHYRKPEEFIEALRPGGAPAAAFASPYMALLLRCFEQLEGAANGSGEFTPGGSEQAPAEGTNNATNNAANKVTYRVTDRDSAVEAFRALLIHLHRTAGARRSDLFRAEPALAQIGLQEGNTYAEAFLAIAQFHLEWVRPVESWRPTEYSARRQFASLVRHLFGRYNVPLFMDTAWFEGQSAEARRRQRWFLHIGAGQNIRTADIPVALSKRAAHHFLQSPRETSIEAAFRWGQIHSLGGDEYLVRAVTSTRLRDFQEDEPFWATVLQFFVNNPMLEQSRIGPIVDYIHSRRFACREFPGEARIPPPDPDFSMKARTPQALWRLVETWPRQLAREIRKPPVRWDPCGIRGFEITEQDEETGAFVSWKIEEILTHQDLVEEGRAMRHCVASYGPACACGRSAVFSVQIESAVSGVYRRVMTVEVQPRRRQIVQARGRCNRTPAERRSSVRLKRTPSILRQWAARERLTIPGHI